jgi:hypothetical protein
MCWQWKLITALNTPEWMLWHLRNLTHIRVRWTSNPFSGSLLSISVRHAAKYKSCATVKKWKTLVRGVKPTRAANCDTILMSSSCISSTYTTLGVTTVRWNIVTFLFTYVLFLQNFMGMLVAGTKQFLTLWGWRGWQKRSRYYITEISLWGWGIALHWAPDYTNHEIKKKPQKQRKLRPSGTGGRNKARKGNPRDLRLFTAVKIQVEVFWVVTPCSVVVGGQHFGEPCCLLLQTETWRQKGPP